MTKDELWATYVARNPQFAGDGRVTLGAKGLRKLFDQTWDQAYAAGLESAGLFGGKNGDIFSEMFGGGKKR